eukprot:1350648-Amorphochlora_amoeboformis.AAC.1
MAAPSLLFLAILGTVSGSYDLNILKKDSPPSRWVERAEKFAKILENTSPTAPQASPELRFDSQSSPIDDASTTPMVGIPPGDHPEIDTGHAKSSKFSEKMSASSEVGEGSVKGKVASKASEDVEVAK